MNVPTQDELLAQIAEKANVSVANVDQVLTDQSVTLVPVPPVKRSIDIRRLSFSGTRINTQWDGPFEKTFDFPYGITAFITSDNLRGKSSILELVTWALRGKPRELRSDVRMWFDHIALEYAVNGVPMAVILTKQENGFEADIIRAKEAADLRNYLSEGIGQENINIIASSLSETQFAKVQDETMMTLLGFEPITNFQKHKGSDQGAARANTWPAYYGGIHLPRNSDLLFGDTVFAGLPARILQMYCNVPLMGTYIRLATLVRVQKQNEANVVRRAREDAAARSEERAVIEARLEALEAQLTTLPSEAGRSFAMVSSELRKAERDFEAALADSREAKRTLDVARAARQEEERRTNNERETELAELLFQGLNPVRCPRCEQKFEAQRTQRELDDHECSVCTKELPESIPHEAESTDDIEDTADADAKDALTALQDAETAAKEGAAEASAKLKSVRSRLNTLDAELTTASQSKEFTDFFEIRMEKSRLLGRLEGFADDIAITENSEIVRVLEATLWVLKKVTAEAATQIFIEVEAEILAMGRKLGIDNLDEVELKRNGGMNIVTAGVQTAFGDASGGERVRLRIAVVMSLLRIGNRSGVGSHPGLVLLDSPGDELTKEAEAKLLYELHLLNSELPTLQVLVASDEPAAVQNNLPDNRIYSSLDGTPLW